MNTNKRKENLIVCKVLEEVGLPEREEILILLDGLILLDVHGPFKDGEDLGSKIGFPIVCG